MARAVGSNIGAGSRRWRRRGRARRAAPLLALAAPVEQVGAGQHELVAVVAVQVPRAGAAVDDGLEGAEAALGGCAAPGQVDRQGLGLLAGQRGSVAGEQLAGVGGAGPGDPDVLQHVLEVGMRQVHVVLGHPVGDLAEVAADVGQAGPGAQQVGGQGVPGLVRHPVTEVEFVHPPLETLVDHL